jgi:flagellar biosynthesis/type III secretory pathway protein FliH
MRYLLLDEQRLAETAFAGQRNVAAALFRLETSRQPADIERVLGSLVEWLATPAQASLRRAFVVWLKRVLLPARVPGAEMPEVTDLQEIHAMLADRVKNWTEEWKQQGLEEGLEQGISQGEAKLLRRLLVRRFGPLPAWAEARLTQASEAELELWADRVLECATLEAVINGSA